MAKVAVDFNKQMWYGFAGCSHWEGNEEPLWRDLGEAFGVADPDCLQVYLGPEGEETWGIFFGEGQTKEFARLVLNALPENPSPAFLKSLGFKHC